MIRSIRKKKLAGYATDVLNDELGNIRENPLIKGLREGLPVIITPHIGGMTIEGQRKAFIHAARKLKK